MGLQRALVKARRKRGVAAEEGESGRTWPGTWSVDVVDVGWRQASEGLAKRRAVVAKDLPKRLK